MDTCIDPLEGDYSAMILVQMQWHYIVQFLVYDWQDVVAGGCLVHSSLDALLWWCGSADAMPCRLDDWWSILGVDIPSIGLDITTSMLILDVWYLIFSVWIVVVMAVIV